MRILALVLIGSLVIVGCNGGGSVASAGNISGKPEDTVKAFVDAVNKGDGKAALDCLVLDNPDGPSADSLLKSQPMKLEASDYKVEMKEPYLASVSYNLKATVPLAPMAVGGTDHVLVLFSQRKWKMLANGIPGAQQQITLGAVASMLELSTVFQQAHEAAQRTAKLSNAKQIALGVIMYAADSDDLNPLPTNTEDAIMPYLKNKALFTAPGDPPGTVSYSFNDKVMGINETSIVSPANTVLLYQGKDHKLAFDKDGKAAVAFCDGSAKSITQAEETSLNWDPKK